MDLNDNEDDDSLVPTFAPNSGGVVLKDQIADAHASDPAYMAESATAPPGLSRVTQFQPPDDATPGDDGYVRPQQQESPTTEEQPGTARQVQQSDQAGIQNQIRALNTPFQAPSVRTPMHSRSYDPEIEQQLRERDQAILDRRQQQSARAEQQEYKRRSMIARDLDAQGVEVKATPDGGFAAQTNPDGSVRYKPGTVDPFKKTDDGKFVKVSRDEQGNTWESELKPKRDPQTGELYHVAPWGERFSVGIDQDFLQHKQLTEAGQYYHAAVAAHKDLGKRLQNLQDMQAGLVAQKKRVADDQSLEGRAKAAGLDDQIAKLSTQIAGLAGPVKQSQAQVDQAEQEFGTHQEAWAARQQAKYQQEHGVDLTAPWSAAEKPFRQDPKTGKTAFDPDRMADGMRAAADEGAIQKPGDAQMKVAQAIQDARQGKKAYQLGQDFTPKFQQGQTLAGLQQAAADGLMAKPSDDQLAIARQADQQWQEIDAIAKKAGGHQMIKAALEGAGRGAAFLAAAPIGAGTGATLGALIPFLGETGIGEAGGGMIGGMITGTLGTIAYEKLLDKLGQYSKTVASLQASAKLHPIVAGAAEMAAFGAGLPKAAMEGVGALIGRGADAAARASDVAGETASAVRATQAAQKAAVKAGGAATGTTWDLSSMAARHLDAIGEAYKGGGGGLLHGISNLRKQAAVQAADGVTRGQRVATVALNALGSAASMVAIDTAFKEGAKALGFSKQGQTVSGAEQAAILGTFMMGHGLQFADYSPEQMGDIFLRGAAHDVTGKGLSDTLSLDELRTALQGRWRVKPDEASTKPLTPEEQQIYNKFKQKATDLIAGGQIPSDLRGIKATARQVLKAGRKTGIAAVNIEGDLPPGVGGVGIDKPVEPEDLGKLLDDAAAKEQKTGSTPIGGAAPAPPDPAELHKTNLKSEIQIISNGLDKDLIPKERQQEARARLVEAQHELDNLNRPIQPTEQETPPGAGGAAGGTSSGPTEEAAQVEPVIGGAEHERIEPAGEQPPIKQPGQVIDSTGLTGVHKKVNDALTQSGLNHDIDYAASPNDKAIIVSSGSFPPTAHTRAVWEQLRKAGFNPEQQLDPKQKAETVVHVPDYQPPAEGAPDAIPEPSASGVLQHPPEGDGETGSERPGVESSQPGQAPAEEKGDTVQQTLRPALIVGGRPQVAQPGESHAQLADRLKADLPANSTGRDRVNEAIIDDNKHVFVDQNGRVLNRQQAGEVADAQGLRAPEHQGKPLQSEHLQTPVEQPAVGEENLPVAQEKPAPGQEIPAETSQPSTLETGSRRHAEAESPPGVEPKYSIPLEPGEPHEPTTDEQRTDATRWLESVLRRDNPNIEVRPYQYPSELQAGDVATGGGEKGVTDETGGFPSPRLLGELEKALRVKVIPVTGKNLFFDGVHFPDKPGHLFINADSPNSGLSIIGHEFTHHLRAVAPDVYNEMLESLRPEFQNLPAFDFLARRASPHYAKLPVDTLDEELVSELMGEQFGNPEFWDKLGTEKPTLFKKVSGVVMNYLNGIWQRLRNFEGEVFTKNLSNVRDILAEAVKKYAGGDAGEDQPKTGEPNDRGPNGGITTQVQDGGQRTDGIGAGGNPGESPGFQRGDFTAEEGARHASEPTPSAEAPESPNPQAEVPPAQSLIDKLPNIEGAIFKARQAGHSAEDIAAGLAKRGIRLSDDAKTDPTAETVENAYQTAKAKLKKSGWVEPGTEFGFGGRKKPSFQPPPNPNQIPATPAALKQTTDAKMPQTVEGLLKLVNPSSLGKLHLAAADTIRGFLGILHRAGESADQALKKHQTAFDKLGVDREGIAPKDNPGVQFASALSTGAPVPKGMELAARVVQSLFGDRLKRMEDVGAPLDAVRQNYFPGMWTSESRSAFNAAMEAAVAAKIIPESFDVNTSTPAQRAWVKAKADEFLENGTGSDKDMLGYLTRNPMAGKESFRKQKVFDDILTAQEFGLRPVSNNPITLVKGKLAEMDRSIFAHGVFQRLKEQGNMRIISPYEQPPEGWIKVDDKYGIIYGPPTVKIPEYVDQRVFDGLLSVAKALGVQHERGISIGGKRLGYSVQGGNQIVTRFGTETSVLAHEIGHQLDYKYGLWDKIVAGAQGFGARGQVTKSASAAMRGTIQRELRAIADQMVGSRGGAGYTHRKEEKIAQMMEGYMHAPEEMQQVAPNVFKAFDAFVKSRPELEPLSKIIPGLKLKAMTGEKYVGLPIMGYRIIPEAHADILNNYLSSSLYNNPYFGGLYKGWMGAASLLNQAQLGVGSAFHAGFTAIDVQTHAAAQAIRDMYGVLRGTRSAGDLVSSIGKAGIAIGRNPVVGDQVLNAWRNPDGTIDPKIAQVVKAAELAGGGFDMERGLVTHQTGKMISDLYSGRPIQAALRSPVAFTELMAKPIMHWLVPRQKAGVFAEKAWRIIEQNPGKPLEELAPEFNRAWNLTDQTLGQVLYDRTFMNNVVKNVAQGSIRAPGWTGGTILALGGAFKDTAGFLKEFATTGQLPKEMPDRVAYTMALLIGGAVVNGALTKALTGQDPKGMDYFAFRDGGKDNEGRETRMLMPSYMKDVLAYAQSPGATLLNKTHPLISMLNETLVKNQDYYGVEIRHPDDSIGQQAKEEGEYVVKQFVPFWIRGVQKQQEEGQSWQREFPAFFGVMPAPKHIIESDAEKEADEISRGKAAVGGRTKAQFEKSQARNKAIEEIAQGKETSFDAIASGEISPHDRTRVEREATMGPLERHIYGFAPEDAVKVFVKATPKEQDQVREMVKQKILRSQTLDNGRKADLLNAMGEDPEAANEARHNYSRYSAFTEAQ